MDDCAACKRPLDPFGRCRRRACPAYSALWVGDVRTKLLRNLLAGPERYRLVTITAPGRDNLLHDGDQVERVTAHRWNSTAPARFTTLNRRTRARTKRRVGCAPRIEARVWQYQRRGVLHVHLLLAAGNELERIAGETYVQELHGLAFRHGFGFVDRKKLEMAGHRAAGYVSSYLTTAESAHQAISETVKHEDVPSHVVYVGRHLTQLTGCTMRTLRLRRYAWVVAQESGHDVDFIYRLLLECPDAMRGGDSRAPPNHRPPFGKTPRRPHARAATSLRTGTGPDPEAHRAPMGRPGRR